MTVSIIVATAEGGVIGKSGAIPWYLPADLAHFKQTTMGHPVIMGRVTHESIGKTLPGRQNIIITHDAGYQAHGCPVVGSLDKALDLVNNEDEVFIIGGDSIYGQALPVADKIYLTKIHTKLGGDKFFKYDPTQWYKVSKTKHKADDKNRYNYDFIVLARAK